MQMLQMQESGKGNCPELQKISPEALAHWKAKNNISQNEEEVEGKVEEPPAEEDVQMEEPEKKEEVEEQPAEEVQETQQNPDEEKTEAEPKAPLPFMMVDDFITQ